ncbi:hypothetical protein ACVMIH_008000 [Bradyrhizobium sp. USDA 4503]
MNRTLVHEGSGHKPTRLRSSQDFDDGYPLPLLVPRP